MDDTFQFDPDIQPMQRFITFKATVIGKGLEVKKEDKDADGDDEDEGQVTTSHIKRQAMFAQKGKKFPSEGARRLDAAYKEVEIMSN